MKQTQIGVCPVCGAAVQENARFCLHCMTSFDEKTEIPVARAKKRTAAWAIPLVCVFLLLLGTGVVLLLKNGATSDPAQTQGENEAALNDFDTFRPAVILTSERMGCDAFWDVDGFSDVEYDKETDTGRYTTALDLSGARLDLFFRGDGKVVTLILSDVPGERLDDAKLLCDAVHAAVSNRYSDFLEIISDDGTYHRTDAGTPYVEFFADMTGRADAYAAALAAGETFSTRYTLIDNEDKTDDDFTVFFETERETADGTLYDLILRFDQYSNDEVHVGGAGE